MSIFVICTACSQQEIAQDNSETAKAVNVADTSVEDNGLITVSSPYSVAETTDRLEKIIKEKGLTLFSRIDHSANAKKVGEELKPTQLLIFGNPQVGTPLMKCSATTAIDLPQKILVLQDDNNQTQVIYNSSEYLQQRHNINGCDQVLEKVSGALKGITEAATK
ncbi:DUF302 domain-containing protein [Pleurocapsa sp. FMAR1]|uniref:DUF302 domain-containing protein n=1 Tax=Pleurocapsa sp. FMAR1 TaxID=3040204 RepID=UPI0029C90F38|nr:DUF302 domain-containing protein [Pleurocapsa sp. FMAR1]